MNTPAATRRETNVTALDIEHRTVSAERSVRITRTECTVLAALAAKPGHIVRRNEFYQALYADRLDGGPLTRELVLHVLIHRLRIKLRAAGSEWTIRNQFGDGYELLTEAA